MIDKDFIPENLKRARIEMGMTMASLAEAIDVTTPAISQFEKGLAIPKPDNLLKLSTTLNKPINFFFNKRDFDFNDSSQIFYRKLTSATKRSRESSYEKSRYVLELIDLIFSILEPVQLNLPDYSDLDFKDLREEDIEAITLNIRDFWNVNHGPIRNLVYLFENNGIICSNLDIPDKIDAFSYNVVFRTEQKEYPIIVLSKNVNYFRYRFNIAHELGHRVLHYNVEENDFVKHHKMIEKQANYFASSFLMPYASFKRDIYSTTLSSILSLKKKWGVSAAAMIYRLKELEIISEDRSRYLNIELSRKGMKKKELYDDDFEIEKPYFIREALEYIMKNDIITETTLRNKLSLNQEDLFEYSMESDIFKSESNGKIIEFRKR